MKPDTCRRSIPTSPVTMRECGRPAVVVYIMDRDRWPLCERHDSASARQRVENEPERYSVEAPRP